VNAEGGPGGPLQPGREPSGVEEAVIEELQKADPGNKLLDQGIRQQIFDEAKEEAVKALRRSS
jgi:hypothetical protein